MIVLLCLSAATGFVLGATAAHAMLIAAGSLLWLGASIAFAWTTHAGWASGVLAVVGALCCHQLAYVAALLWRGMRASANLDLEDGIAGLAAMADEMRAVDLRHAEREEAAREPAGQADPSSAPARTGTAG